VLLGEMMASPMARRSARSIYRPAACWTYHSREFAPHRRGGQWVALVELCEQDGDVALVDAKVCGEIRDSDDQTGESCHF
jgi:hypothetical protein